jgi:uncharacterized transporter YbjL
VASALSENRILTLLAVIGPGYLVGEMNLFGFCFGVAVVLFVGLAVGSPGRAPACRNSFPHSGLIRPGILRLPPPRGHRDNLLAACLACATSQAQSDRPNLGYASECPPMIRKIILSQVLAAWMGTDSQGR